ncbi:MAG: LCP family protein [Carboxydocellales bacterium]
MLFLWTDKNQLKVITLLTINHDVRKVGLVTIPLACYYPGEPNKPTIGEIYKQRNKERLIYSLEGYLGTPIPHQIEVEQQSLQKMSDILGSFIVNGDTLDMAQAFLQTSTAQRTDDQDVVRAIANKLIRPSSLVKLPQLVYIMVREVHTNLKVKDIWRIFREFQGTDVGGLRKTALPGREYLERGKLYREVPVEAWKRILVRVSE